MGHVVLLGDSIFDNASYVPDRPPVIDQLRRCLPGGWRATLLAIDGHCVEDVEAQLKHLPPDATHLVASAGGNDALGETHILREPACTVGDALSLLAEVRTRFIQIYQAMVKVLAAVNRSTAVCTIYDAIPGLESAASAALAVFNEIILREAFAARLPVIDLRLVCRNHADYSTISPIEPSEVGGAKIARAIASLVSTHDFDSGRSSIYV